MVEVKGNPEALFRLVTTLEATIPYAKECELSIDGRSAATTLSELVMQLREVLATRNLQAISDRISGGEN